MLYPKSAEKKLTQEQFRHPGSEYRGAPFWAWNCRLEKEELLRQLEVLKEMGLGGAHMHVRTGMATPYLSDEHMALIKACVEKCRHENMLAWLYDEDRWPSGAAGGLLTKDPQYRARHLLLTTKPYGEGKAEARLDSSARTARSENGTLLACYDVQLDENGCLTGATRIAERRSGGTEMVRLSGDRPAQPVVQQPDLRQHAGSRYDADASWRSPTSAIWKPSARTSAALCPPSSPTSPSSPTRVRWPSPGRKRT